MSNKEPPSRKAGGGQGIKNDGGEGMNVEQMSKECRITKEFLMVKSGK